LRLVLAQVCTSLGHYDEARTQLAAVLDNPAHEPPTHARALNLRAEWHVAQGEFAAANESFRAALALAPDSAEIHTAFGMNLLRLGDFAAAWEHYEWHDRVPFFRRGDGQTAIDRRVGGRRWTGEDLHGKTILVWDDQGFGDAIQFFRYLELLHRAGATRIIHHTFPVLAPLFAAAAPFAEIVSEPPVGAAIDFCCATSSLPAGFGTQANAIPARVPYLAAPRGRRAARLPKRDGLQVGLVWSGDPRHLRDHLRSIPAELFLQIAELPGIAFHCLQTAVRPGDEAALAAHRSVSRIGETMRDFADSAAVIARLDLVITVDSAPAHLAGALAKPVWILLPQAADWRWLTERGDSPWYPTARLFRADQRGWQPVLRRVMRALQSPRP
jgi:hypothetical protein